MSSSNTTAQAVENPCPQIAGDARLMAFLGPGHPCPSCQAGPGQVHSDGCLVAGCPRTGRRRQGCAADQYRRFQREDRHDCGTDIWPGYDRVCRDAINLGWFTLEGLNVTVPIDAPGAVPDVDRVRREAVWNPNTLTWEPSTLWR